MELVHLGPACHVGRGENSTGLEQVERWHGSYVAPSIHAKTPV